MSLEQQRFPETLDEFKWWAAYLYNYYSCLSESAKPEVRQDGIWVLGQYAAFQWQRLLASPHPIHHEAALLLGLLKAERKNQGSQWQEMTRMVEAWIETLEEHGSGTIP